MKTVVTFLLSIVFAVNAYAAEPADKKLAMEYLKVSQFEQMIDATIEAYSRQLLGNVPKENRVFFEKMMRDTMGWEVIKDDLANLVISTYSKGELKAYLGFAKTPLGAAFNAKSVRFSDEMTVLVANNLQKFINQAPLPVPNPTANPAAAQ